MLVIRIILVLVASGATGCRPWAPPKSQTLPPVHVQEYPTTGAPVFAGPPYLQPSPMLMEPGPGAVPVFPAGPPPAQVPLPSQTPGMLFGPPPGTSPVPAGPLADIAPGGMVSPQFGLPNSPDVVPTVASSINVPVANDEWAWDQITDVVSDYFTITSEKPARRGGEVAMEGRIETAPQGGATWLEPQRNDSVGRFNRWESTFQTIRRRATIFVIPEGAGYTITIAVDKELEDLPRPERATAGSATFRNDGSLPTARAEQVSRTRSSARWIPLGRDPPLEQRMLAEIHSRLTGVAASGAPVFVR